MRMRGEWFAVCVVFVHVLLLAWLATRHSPVVDEVGHLPAGLSHWKVRRFDLYNVNPPLVRTLATLPLVVGEVPVDFTGYQVLPRNRSEFGIGSRWISSNPDSFLTGFTIARWACLPFSILGAVTCLLWARELYGSRAGLMALCLWCFCPNILAHCSLITPDAGATAVGLTACYVFRKWLIHRTLGWAVFAGILLGLTLLTKFTWLFLLGLWPLCWVIWRFGESRGAYCRTIVPIVHESANSTAKTSSSELPTGTEQLGQLLYNVRDDIGHLSLIMLLAFWVLNNGYLFEDSFQPLGKFQFFSQSLSGHESGVVAAEGGNRFRGTLLEHLPMPVPRNFLQGIDHIKWEYEHGYPSYLRGVKRHGGWWYYYLYAMLVKMPVGTLVLIGVAAGAVVCRRSSVCANASENEVQGERQGVSPPSEINVISRRADAAPLAGGMLKQSKEDAIPPGTVGVHWFETFYLLAPAVCTLWLVSSQTGFNHHLRYVLPAFPFLFIFASRTALLLDSRSRLIKGVPIVCMAWMILSSLSVYPHSLSYFNELAGGPINGWKHLDYSNIDWGQDMIYVKEWVEQHPEAKPLYILSTGYVTPEQMGIETQPLQMTTQPLPDGKSLSREFAPGWYIMGLTRLVDPNDPFHELLQREPDGYIGYSMRVYHVR